MNIEIEIEYCSKCPFGKLYPDYSSPDSFENNSQIKCEKLNKIIHKYLGPFEIGKYDKVPNECPFNNNNNK